MIKVYILEGDNLPYAKAFDPELFEITDSIKDAEVICFTGGSDVHPATYGKDLKGSYGCDPVRDLRESYIMFKYMHDKVLVGICRGFQLLSSFSKDLYIEQDNSKHSILAQHKLSNGEVVNSLHHQVVKGVPTPIGQYVSTTDYSEVLYSDDGIESWTIDWDGTFGVQWHPELHEKGEFGYDYFNEQIVKLCK